MTNPSSKPRTALIVQQSFSPFGNKLVQSGYIDNERMRQALMESRRSKRPLVDVLESITGQQLPPELLRQYKRQQLFELKILYGVDSLDPEIDAAKVSTSQVSALITSADNPQGLISVDLCRRYQLIPLSRTESTVLVAMVDPDKLDALDDLNRLLRTQSLSLQRIVVTVEDYQQIFDRYLEEQSRKQKQIEVKTDDLDFATLEDTSDEADESLEAALSDADAAPIIALADKILAKALLEGVSDIHIEPQDEFLRVRYRKDGVLRQALDPLPKKIIPAVTSRFKIIANLDIAERRQPQDGRIQRRFQGRRVDFRVSSLPSRYGEKIVLRILDNTSTQLGLVNLITDPDSLAVMRQMVSRPFGLILVTGPTGSGKTTTLYSALKERNDPGVNICTVEDPIEYTLSGLTQVQVLREKGVDFPTVLRAFLRQDPDVILVGETRDKETAKTAIEAALTGHLVLTTLHTNDAASAIARLDEMGIEPFMVSSSLIGVLAQRLVRKVCPECRVPYTPSGDELARFGLSASRHAELTFYKANTLLAEEILELRARGGAICTNCGGSGYKGRCGVFEIMRVTEELQVYITAGAPTERIKEVAVEQGMKTLLAYSLDLVRQGLTTLDEVERVTFTDVALEAELKAKRKSSLSCRACGAELKQEWLDCPYCTTPRFSD